MTARECAVLAAAIRAANGGATSCCLHIVIDDGNLRNGDVDFCIDYARERMPAHVACLALAEELRRHSRHWRHRVARYAWALDLRPA